MANKSVLSSGFLPLDQFEGSLAEFIKSRIESAGQDPNAEGSVSMKVYIPGIAEGFGSLLIHQKRTSVQMALYDTLATFALMERDLGATAVEIRVGGPSGGSAKPRSTSSASRSNSQPQPRGGNSGRGGGRQTGPTVNKGDRFKIEAISLRWVGGKSNKPMLDCFCEGGITLSTWAYNIMQPQEIKQYDFGQEYDPPRGWITAVADNNDYIDEILSA